MKLVLVHDWLTGMRGGEKCLEIVCRRFPDAPLLTLLHVPGSTSPAIERMQIRTSFLQRFPGVGRYYRNLLPLMPRAIERMSVPRDADLVLSFSHAVAKSIKPPRGVPHVCYCFTPMRYAWHLRDEYLPRRSHGLPSLPRGRGIEAPWYGAQRLVLDRLQRWDRQTADRVSKFVAISRTVSQRIADCYGRESTVIHPPVDTDFYTPDGGPRDDFYLCVSALVPYKRIDLAIQACNRLKRRLVVIGRGPQQRRLEKLAGPTIQLLGWRSDDEIRAYLRRCRALLFPGHEDFGIVPLEAQACGAPVIALAKGGALETVVPASDQSAGTGVFFDEPTVDSLVEAMLRLERKPTMVCPTLARRQALRFTKSRYESELIALLESVAQRRLAA